MIYNLLSKSGIDSVGREGADWNPRKNQRTAVRTYPGGELYICRSPLLLFGNFYIIDFQIGYDSVGDPQVDAQVCSRGTREFKAREGAKLDGWSVPRLCWTRRETRNMANA